MSEATTGRKAARKRRPPALSLEDREIQLSARAMELAEERLMDGTASNQVILYYLKLGSAREQMERDKLRRENDLLQAKVKALEAATNNEELYAKAIMAMKSYQGTPVADYYSDEYE